MLKFTTLFTFWIIIYCRILFSQAGVGINSLPPNEAAEYTMPIATWFGSLFNSGGYYSADVPKDFRFKFSLLGMYIMIPESQNKFSANPGLNGYSNLGETATITGSTGGVYLGPDGFISYPHGFDISSLPAGIYQLAGSIQGTELLLRFFPTISAGDAEAGFWGIGLKHNFSQWLVDFPLDISVQLLYNSMGIEYTGNNPKNYVKMDSKNFAVNAHASKTFQDMFIVYGGLQYESSSMDLDYYFRDPNELYPLLRDKRHSTTVDGDNSFRFTAGGAIKLSVLVINFDLNVASQFTLAGGLSLQF